MSHIIKMVINKIYDYSNYPLIVSAFFGIIGALIFEDSIYGYTLFAIISFIVYVVVIYLFF